MFREGARGGSRVVGSGVGRHADGTGIVLEAVGIVMQLDSRTVELPLHGGFRPLLEYIGHGSGLGEHRLDGTAEFEVDGVESLEALLAGDASDPAVIVRHLQGAFDPIVGRSNASAIASLTALADADAHLREDESCEIAGFLARTAIEQAKQEVDLPVLASGALRGREVGKRLVDLPNGEVVSATTAGERTEPLLAAELVAGRDLPISPISASRSSTSSASTFVPAARAIAS